MAVSSSAGSDTTKPRLLLLFALGHFANDLAPVGMYLIIPAFGVAMGLSPVEIGLLFTIHSIGAAVAFLPAGVVTDHVANRGRLLLATFFWVGIGYFAASFARDFWTFAILITLAGAGDAAWHPIATGVLTRSHKDRRAYAIGVHAVGGFMAEVFGLIVAGWLLSQTDWRFTLQVLVVPALAMGLAFIFVAPRVPRIDALRPDWVDLMTVWRCWTTRSGLRIVSLFTVYNMAFFALLTMTPVFLNREHAFDWHETAFALATMMVLGAVVQPAIGRLSDIVGRRKLLVFGNGAAALAALVAWQAPTLAVTLLALGTAMTLLLSIRAVVLARAVDHAGGREGTSLGLAFLFMDGLGATAAVAAGFVGEFDLRHAFLLAGGFSVIAVCLALREPKPRKAEIEETTSRRAVHERTGT